MGNPEKIMFSIVMPLYNKAAYVKKALNSVVAQTCSDWELIVVDDGSTDGSATVVTEWLQVTGYRLQGDYFVHAQHPHIKVIRQPNQGVSVARNNNWSCAMQSVGKCWKKCCLPQCLQTMTGMLLPLHRYNA